VETSKDEHSLRDRARFENRSSRAKTRFGQSRIWARSLRDRPEESLVLILQRLIMLLRKSSRPAAVFPPGRRPSPDRLCSYSPKLISSAIYFQSTNRWLGRPRDRT
jgi:hypothetical protein